MEHPKDTERNVVPLWLIFVLSGILLQMLLIIIFILLVRFRVFRCLPIDNLISPATPTTVVYTPEPEKPVETRPAITTPEPIIIHIPTEAPTEEPTPEPTPVPDSFLFGGKTVKTGTTKLRGKDLGINGKKNALTHITDEEVQNLVALCPDLEVLDLDYCYMDDYAPLGALIHLREVQLSSCGVGGGNAIEDIDWVAGLTELRSLNLVHNEIRDTSALEGLTALEWLNLGDNALTDEDLEPIGKLENLDMLYLYSLAQITDVAPLSELSNLTYLHLGGDGSLRDVKPLISLKNLAYLRLNDTKVSDLSCFGNFSALKKLDLSRCPIRTDTVYHLQDCKKLETIVLDMGDSDTYLAILDLINLGCPFHFLYSWSE